MDWFDQFNKRNDIKQMISEWKELMAIREDSDDHVHCPMCREQLYFCDCVAWMALVILEKQTGGDSN